MTNLGGFCKLWCKNEIFEHFLGKFRDFITFLVFLKQKSSIFDSIFGLHLNKRALEKADSDVYFLNYEKSQIIVKKAKIGDFQLKYSLSSNAVVKTKHKKLQVTNRTNV